ncbi:hypothetical protein Tco_1083772 [Tanacetum coccineum]
MSELANHYQGVTSLLAELELSTRIFEPCRMSDNHALALVDGDVEEVGDLILEAMENDEVALVDGVFEGAFGALGDEKGLEVEALVDAMEVMVVNDE